MARTWYALLLAATACVGLLDARSTAAPQNEGGPAAAVGQPAPNFELKDIYGKPFSPAEFKGKIVVLEWFNRNCPFVQGRHSDATMQKTYAKYAGKGVIWLAIDSTATAKPEDDRVFAAEQQVACPILMDPDGRAARAYGAKSTPHMFVIDRTGKLAYSGAIDDDPGGQKPKKEVINHVAAAIDDLLANKPVATSKTTPYGCGVKLAK